MQAADDRRPDVGDQLAIRVVRHLGLNGIDNVPARTRSVATCEYASPSAAIASTSVAIGTRQGQADWLPAPDGYGRQCRRNDERTRMASEARGSPSVQEFPRGSRSRVEGVSPPVTLPRIGHLALRVRDMTRSRTFYEQALEPFGVTVVESSRGPGFAIEGGGDFWIEEGEPPAAPVHLAFAAADRATVDKFHRAAVQAGGRDNGAPGGRPHYHAGYYAAFVIDPDGNNVEAVFHGDRQLPAT